MLKAKESLLEEALDMTCQINSQESYDSFISKLSAARETIAEEGDQDLLDIIDNIIASSADIDWGLDKEVKIIEIALQELITMIIFETK